MFSKKPSGKPIFSLTITPKTPAAASASIALMAGVPLVPNSPLVKSKIPTYFPSATSLAMVPPQPNSTSSGCAAIPSKSISIKL